MGTLEGECMSNEYEGVRRVVYGDSGATFVPVCNSCGRFVKAPEKIQIVGDTVIEPTVWCEHCGNTRMLFEGCI